MLAGPGARSVYGQHGAAHVLGKIARANPHCKRLLKWLLLM